LNAARFALLLGLMAGSAHADQPLWEAGLGVGNPDPVISCCPLAEG